eukprot:gene18029-19835_t
MYGRILISVIISGYLVAFCTSLTIVRVRNCTFPGLCDDKESDKGIPLENSTVFFEPVIIHANKKIPTFTPIVPRLNEDVAGKTRKSLQYSLAIIAVLSALLVTSVAGTIITLLLLRRRQFKRMTLGQMGTGEKDSGDPNTQSIKTQLNISILGDTEFLERAESCYFEGRVDYIADRPYNCNKTEKFKNSSDQDEVFYYMLPKNLDKQHFDTTWNILGKQRLIESKAQVSGMNLTENLMQKIDSKENLKCLESEEHLSLTDPVKNVDEVVDMSMVDGDGRVTTKQLESDDYEVDCLSRRDTGFSSLLDNSDTIILETRAKIGPRGGQLKVEGSSVIVNVPKGAIIGKEQEISLKVYLGPPNDYEELERLGHTVELPLVELGPSGLRFNRPVEVVTQNSSVDPDDANDEDDGIDFEYADGMFKPDTVWKKALRGSTREESIALAVEQEPHVSFFVTGGQTCAYYMHFTLGRKLLKRSSRKNLAACVYADGKHVQVSSCLRLGIFFYENSEEGETRIVIEFDQFLNFKILQRNTSGMEKVSLPKPFSVRKGASTRVQMQNLTDGWRLKQGHDEQEVSLENFFQASKLGKLSTSDYIIENEEDPSSIFTCLFDLHQDNNKLADLKVMGRIIGRQYSVSSGYNSDASSVQAEEETYRIKEPDVPKSDPRKYMNRIIYQLSTLAAPKYKSICRNLGISEIAIETAEMDRGREGCYEVCCQLLLQWLRNHDDGGHLIETAMSELKSAVERTKLHYTIHFPSELPGIVYQDCSCCSD